MLIIDFGPKERACQQEGRKYMRRSYDSEADRRGSETTCLSLDRGNPEIRLRALSLFLTPEIPSICRYRELVNSLILLCKFEVLSIYDSRGLNSVSFRYTVKKAHKFLILFSYICNIISQINITVT